MHTTWKWQWPAIDKSLHVPSKLWRTATYGICSTLYFVSHKKKRCNQGRPQSSTEHGRQRQKKREWSILFLNLISQSNGRRSIQKNSSNFRTTGGLPALTMFTHPITATQQNSQRGITRQMNSKNWGNPITSTRAACAYWFYLSHGGQESLRIEESGQPE